MKKLIFFFILILIEPIASVSIHSKNTHPFERAYPNVIESISVSDNTVTFRNGIILPYNDGKEKSFDETLANSDIKDMLSQVYPRGFSEPGINSDPGRFRNNEFFHAMYGKTRNEIEKKLTTIVWMPGISGAKLRVTTVNNVHIQFRRVSSRLLQLPKKYHKYVNNPAGSYMYRQIAGTNRLSPHSYGISIDINIEHAHYWRWDLNDSKIIRYRNSIPKEIVDIFEEHGFIWGGKWYHYDTMHFEYRPELVESFIPDSIHPIDTEGGYDLSHPKAYRQ